MIQVQCTCTIDNLCRLYYAHTYVHDLCMYTHAHFAWLDLPEQAMGCFPIDLGLTVEDKPTEFRAGR